MFDLFITIYCISVATLLFHGWRERRSEFIKHASVFEWAVVAILTFCPIVNTAAAVNVWWKWMEEK